MRNETFLRIKHALACSRAGCNCQQEAKNGACVSHCPSHADQSPSLALAEKDGKVLVHCHAGCSQEDVLAALEKGGLWGAGGRRVPLAQAAGYRPQATGGNPKAEARSLSPGGVKRYEVRSGGGGLVAFHCRGDGEDGKRFWWEGPDGKVGLGGLRVANLPLYGAERLGELADGETVVVTEGEKAAEALWGVGIRAVGTVTGASGRPSDASLEVLRRFSVILWPDADSVGAKHMVGVGRRLMALGCEKLEVLEWLGNGAAGVDAADAVGDGVDVKVLLETAVDWSFYEPFDKAQDRLGGGGASREEADGEVRPHPFGKLRAGSNLPPKAGEGTGADGDDEGLRLRLLAEVGPEEISWLWYPYIPFRKLTLLDGDPGVGKSWVALAIASAVSTGKGLGDESDREAGNVIIASAEDGLSDTIRPRLDKLGADVSRIKAVDSPLSLDENGFLALAAAVVGFRPRLLVLDPLVAYLGTDVDIHRANQARHIMSRLARLAETNDLAVLAVRHLTKGGASKPIYRGLGSIDFTASCRSVLLAGSNPNDPEARALVQIKANLAAMGAAVGYEMRDDGFHWMGRSLLTAADILAIDNTEGGSALEEAMVFLKEALGKGPVAAREVLSEAESQGLKVRTLKRAKALLEVQTTRHGERGKQGGGRFMWALPDVAGEAWEGDDGLEDQDAMEPKMAL